MPNKQENGPLRRLNKCIDQMKERFLWYNWKVDTCILNRAVFQRQWKSLTLCTLDIRFGV